MGIILAEVRADLLRGASQRDDLLERAGDIGAVPVREGTNRCPPGVLAGAWMA